MRSQTCWRASTSFEVEANGGGDDESDDDDDAGDDGWREGWDGASRLRLKDKFNRSGT